MCQKYIRSFLHSFKELGLRDHPIHRKSVKQILIKTVALTIHLNILIFHFSFDNADANTLSTQQTYNRPTGGFVQEVRQIIYASPGSHGRL